MNRRWSSIIGLFSFLIIVICALYFRTLPLQRHWAYSPEKVREQATPVVIQWLQENRSGEVRTDSAEFESVMQKVLATMPGDKKTSCKKRVFGFWPQGLLEIIQPAVESLLP